eukprot:14838446-Alexandrium_andersonii.AAC.1
MHSMLCLLRSAFCDLPSSLCLLRSAFCDPRSRCVLARALASFAFRCSFQQVKERPRRQSGSVTWT